jgi:aspartate-semialdehyde dehydrogenase
MGPLVFGFNASKATLNFELSNLELELKGVSMKSEVSKFEVRRFKVQGSQFAHSFGALTPPPSAPIFSPPDMNERPHVAVVGATGAVGIEMLKTLEKRSFPVGQLTLLASSRSAGKKLKFRGQEVKVQGLSKDSFEGIEIALFSAGGSISKEFAPIAARAGCIVIDNSSAFRMDDKVPLVIPEINPGDVEWHQGIIANPNCTTAIALMAVYPLHRTFGCRRIFASSYQAVSGTGAKAIIELERQVKQIVGGQPATPEVYPHQIAFNVLPHVDSFLPNGYTKEEMKMENEGRKIMHHPTFRASVTCVRVPVYRAHSVAITAEFEKPASVEAARDVLSKAPGLQVVDEPAKNRYPLPLYQAEQYDCAVGRLRKDCAMDNGLAFWVSGDQLLKGAALNAVQIAEELMRRVETVPA